MELFKLFGSIAIDNTKAKDALNETSTEAQKTGDETSSAFEKIGSIAGKIAIGIGAAGAVIGGAFVGAVEGTREYRKEMGLLEAAYLTAGHSSEAAKQTYSELNAVLGDSGQAVEASQHLAVLVDNEKDLQTWTDICTGVYATFGASLPIEGLTEAANETAKTGILTGGLTDALNWAGISEEEFQAKLDKCTNEQERQNLIMNTLNSTYSKASEQYKATNADVLAAEKANQRLNDAFAKVGAACEPIMTRIKNAIAGMAERAVPIIESLIKKFTDMSKWVKNNEDTIKKWVAVIIGATVTIGTFLLILNWSKIMTAAANAVKLVRTAILAMNAAMLANPIGLVVALIAGLVAAFLYLWKNCDSFRAFWIKLWDKIKSAGGKAIDWIKNKFNDFKSALSTVRKVFGDIQNTISEKINGAKNAVDKAVKKIKDFFNIRLKFKGISMPDISIGWKTSPKWMYEAAKLIGLDGVPKFSVKWNAEGAVLTKPTIFGRTGNTYLGGGEDGAEAIAPIDVLQDYTRQAVAEGMNATIYTLVEETREIVELLRQLLQRNIYLDSGVLVGELAPAIDMQLSDIYEHTSRGNTL